MRFCSQGNSLRIENDILAGGAQFLKHFGCSFGGGVMCDPNLCKLCFVSRGPSKNLEFLGSK